MAQSADRGIEVALKTLIRHLVLSFPETTILSRQVGDRYHVVVIVPYAGGPENTLQVERAWLLESARSIKASERLLESLDLPRLFQTRERVELRHPSTPHLMLVSRNPANEGWSGEPLSGTVCHGPLPLSGPSPSTPPGALSGAYSK
jgi:hypothetical protein